VFRLRRSHLLDSGQPILYFVSPVETANLVANVVEPQIPLFSVWPALAFLQAPPYQRGSLREKSPASQLGWGALCSRRTPALIRIETGGSELDETSAAQKRRRESRFAHSMAPIVLRRPQTQVKRADHRHTSAPAPSSLRKKCSLNSWNSWKSFHAGSPRGPANMRSRPTCCLAASKSRRPSRLRRTIEA